MQPIKKPATRINIAFFTLLLIGSFVIFSSVEAKVDCQKEYSWSSQWPIDPIIELQCRKKWDYLTRMQIRAYYLNQR